MGGAVAGASSLASAGLNFYGDVLKGKGTKAADDYSAARLERKAEIGRTAAIQTGAQLDEKLTMTLGNIDAVRAAAHDDPTSPTGVAVRDYQEAKGNRATNIAVENITAQAEQDEADADYLRKAGKFAMDTSYIAGAADLLKFGGGTNFSNFGFGGQ